MRAWSWCEGNLGVWREVGWQPERRGGHTGGWKKLRLRALEGRRPLDWEDGGPPGGKWESSGMLPVNRVPLKLNICYLLWGEAQPGKKPCQKAFPKNHFFA